jgi:hypothetical protein
MSSLSTFSTRLRSPGFTSRSPGFAPAATAIFTLSPSTARTSAVT